MRVCALGLRGGEAAHLCERCGWVPLPFACAANHPRWVSELVFEHVPGRRESLWAGGSTSSTSERRVALPARPAQLPLSHVDHLPPLSLPLELLLCCLAGALPPG